MIVWIYICKINLVSAEQIQIQHLNIMCRADNLGFTGFSLDKSAYKLPHNEWMQMAFYLIAHKCLSFLKNIHNRTHKPDKFLGSHGFSKKNPGADEIIINTSISYIKREILAALKEGKAVNLLDLGELYIGATGSGLFLAPADEKGEISDDESTWLDCTALVRQNTPKKIDFYLPENANNGSSYRIVIKSNYVNGYTKRKEPMYTYSEVVTVA